VGRFSSFFKNFCFLFFFPSLLIFYSC
jgi:hypothetical protein